MIDLPVFISYRRDDGAKVASWLRESLQGRSVWISDPVCYSGTISAYFDQASPAVPDWKKLQHQALEEAKAFLLVCSPGAMHEFPDDDLYHEIRWWLNNRASIAPILITWLEERWIPTIVRERWPRAQFINVDADAWQALAFPDRESATERGIQSILNGISGSIGRGPVGDSIIRTERFLGSGLPGFYYWEKDKFFRYIDCSESYAQAAGCDSPQAVKGKTDDDMSWRSLADLFRTGDQQIISGKGPPRSNVQEKEIMVDRVADILVNEGPLLDRRGECIGVVGHFADITGIVGHLAGMTSQELIPKRVANKEEKRTYQLGVEFGNEYLSAIEGEVIKGILNLYSADRIAGLLNITRVAVEFHIQSIKHKLQCVTEGEVIATAIRSGLQLTLFGPHIIGELDLKVV
jgi:DNA-binding CsgD family transcriptional regulator/PAS domain-containing protein